MKPLLVEWKETSDTALAASCSACGGLWARVRVDGRGGSTRELCASKWCAVLSPRWSSGAGWPR